MPITLAQAQQLSQSKLTGFVIDEFRKSALLDMMVFDNTITPQGESLAYSYNRITTLPTAAARAINSEYVPQEAVTTRQNINLKVFGGSFQVDRVIAAHERAIVDHVQFQIRQKTNATIALYHDMFINGDSGVGDGTTFDGLEKAITGSSTELIPSSAIDLSTSAAINANWQAFLDRFDEMSAELDGTPTLYLVNPRMYARFQSVMKRAGINLASKENYGNEVLQYGKSLVMALGDKPGTSSPIIETDGSTGLTSVFALRIALDGVHTVTPDGLPLVKAYLPNLNAPGAVKTGEVEMIAAMVLKSTKAAGVLRKVKIA